MTQRRSFTMLAACGAAAAAFAAVPSAAASPLDNPLIDTTCTYAQVEAALRAEAPEFADRLAQNPQAQGKMQEFLGLPVDQRQERIQGLLDRNPDMARMVEERKASPQGQQALQTMQRVDSTCQNY